ncbi:MAG: DUF502 domain-containing protein [Pirellulaceae bacterium]|nr:DUF502 domain-containing protein [Planctomycetales bacterium]
MVWWKRILRRFSGIFLTGLLAVLPLIVTVAIVLWVVDLLGKYLGPETVLGKGLAKLGVVIAPDATIPYIIGWIVVLVVVGTLGLFLQLGARNLFHTWMDRLFRRIPLIGAIYGTSKQVVDLFERKDDAAIQGMTAVFCFYGGERNLGLLALLVSPDRYHIDGIDFHVVIIPTAPVPFGGALFFVPCDQVVPAKISVDALMSIYVSMGVTAKDFLPVPTNASWKPASQIPKPPKTADQDKPSE